MFSLALVDIKFDVDHITSIVNILGNITVINSSILNVISLATLNLKNSNYGSAFFIGGNIFVNNSQIYNSILAISDVYFSPTSTNNGGTIIILHNRMEIINNICLYSYGNKY